jgi:hypothetical protein
MSEENTCFLTNPQDKVLEKVATMKKDFAAITIKAITLLLLSNAKDRHQVCI